MSDRTSPRVTSNIPRRTFLGRALGASVACALGANLPHPLSAIEPIRRTGPARLQLSLSAYSFNRYLNLKGKTKPTMTLEDFIDLGGKLELPAVELTAYYFRETTNAYLDALKDRCRRLRLAISGTAVGNDFCLPDAARLRLEVDMVKAWIERTARLGGKTLRIFAGRVAKDDTEANARRRCIQKIEEVCEHAAKHQVLLALENHGGITATADQMLEIVRAVRSNWFAVNLDTANFRTADPYGDLARLSPYSVVVQLKTEIFPSGRREETDIPRIVEMLKKVNYQGYVALEYEAAEDPRVAVPRHVDRLKKLLG